MTPERITSLWLDVPTTITTENSWGFQREREEIARGRGLAEDLERNGAGGIQQRARCEQIFYVHESASGLALAIDLSDLISQALTGSFRIIYRQKPSSMSGATTGADPDYNVSGQGDPYIVKSIGATTDISLVEDTADLAAFPKPVQPNGEMLPMRRVGVGRSVFPSNQGFQLRFAFPGTQSHAPDQVMSFYFGGSLFNGGGGQYCLTFTGDGVMRIFVLLPTNGVGTNLTWYLADTLRYSAPDQVMAKAHTVVIDPYQRPANNNNWVIEFRTSAAEDTIAIGSKGPHFLPPEHSTRRTLFNLATAPLLPAALKSWVRRHRASAATGPSPLRIDIRQDQAPEFQIATLTYPTTAAFDDDPFWMEESVGSVNNLDLWWSAITPAGCGVAMHLYDADTNTELTLIARGPYSANYAHPATGGNYQPRFYARFVFTSSGAETAALYAYVIRKDGTTTYVAPSGAGTQAPLYAPLEVQITGAGADPSHDGAMMHVNDENGDLAVLDKRSRMAARIETTDPYTWPGKNIVLARGYVDEAPSEPVGHDIQGGANQPHWATRSPRLLGEWVRLHSQLSSVRIPMTNIAASGGGGVLTQKVTDFIRRALYWAGYPPAAVDIPDSGLVFAPSTAKDAFLLDVNTVLADAIMQWAQRYLGWWLMFDENAGQFDGTTGRPSGMWRMKQPPTGPAANGGFFDGGGNFLLSGQVRYSFTTQAPAGRVPIDHPSAYASGWTFVASDTLKRWTVAPEGNEVRIQGVASLDADGPKGIVNSYCFNPKSANFGGMSTADLNSEDWIGYPVPVRVADIGIIGQEYSDLFARTIYRQACHGRRMRSFVAPLQFIYDGADTVTTDPTNQVVGPFGSAPAYSGGQPRPLRFYDIIRLVTADADEYCLVHSCNPDYDHDGYQWQFIECQALTASTFELPVHIDTGD